MLPFRFLTVAALLAAAPLTACSGGGGGATLPASAAPANETGAGTAAAASDLASSSPTLLASDLVAPAGRLLAASNAYAGSGSTVVFADTFEQDAVGASDPAFTVQHGTFQVCTPPGGSHEYCQLHNNGIATAASSALTDYTVAADVVAASGNAGVALLGRYVDYAHYYQLELRNDVRGSGAEMWYIWRHDGFTDWHELAGGPLQIDKTGRYRLELTFSGSSIGAAIAYDGSPTFQTLGSASDATFASGAIGLRSWNTTTAAFDNVLVTAPSGAAPPPSPSPSAPATTRPTPSPAPVRPTPAPPPPTARPTAAPTTRPTMAPSASPAPVASPAFPVSGVRYPTPGSFGLFPSSLMVASYASPRIDPNDAAWKSENGITGFDPLRVTTSDAGAAGGASYTNDPSQPIYYCVPGGPGCVKYAMNCTLYTVHCTSGTPFWCPSKAVPQGVSDGHVTCIDEQSNVVTSLWDARPNPGSGTWSSGSGAQCSLSGNAENCGATAANVPLAVGTIKAEDLQSGIYTLPYAIQAAIKCEAPPQAGVIAPATWGDGSTNGCPQTGQRIFLFNYTAAQIDATSNPEWAKKILRTMLPGSHGIVLCDTNPYAGGDGGGGISLEVESALTFTQFGYANPWKAIVATAPLGSSPPAGVSDIMIPHAGIDLSNLHFADV